VIALPTLRVNSTSAAATLPLLIHLLSLVVIERREKVGEIAVAAILPAELQSVAHQHAAASSRRISGSVGKRTCSDENAGVPPDRDGSVA
jgi:hypothetical protein